MPLQLYNSLTRQTEAFTPADPDRVTMYVCGPTVYNYVHIGNARPPVVFGVLAALLRRRYGKVIYARNITDVDDKINAAARELGVPISTITDKYTAAYQDHMARLGVPAPDVQPHATTHIPHIVAMIERLIASGHAYAAEGHVLFSVASYAEYGALSRRDPDEMLAGARVEVAPYKRDAGDFVLWKPSSDDLPGWDSPWGRGRPGWHIECSAMAEAHLGDTIDIHAGGIDLQFPHHENEIAQSTCAHGGKVFARYWLHNGMLMFDGAKMSKSIGNVSRVNDLLDRHPAEALRYALLSAHYRQPLEWSDALVEQSVRTLDRLYGTLRDLGDIGVSVSDADIPASIEAALEDDINTPAALAELAGIRSEAQRINYTYRITKGETISVEAQGDSEFASQRVARSQALRRYLLELEKSPDRYAQFLLPIVRRRRDKELDDRKAWLASLKTELEILSNHLEIAKKQLLAAGRALGLLQQEPAAWFARGTDADDDARIAALVGERNAAKKARDFARADAIREQLAAEGIALEDTAQGVRWRRA